MAHLIDNGRQPVVHYCTERPRGDGTIAGCPAWPGCLFPESRERIVTAADDVTAERLAHLDLANATTHTTDRHSTVGEDLMALGGMAAGCVLFLGVVALLLSFFV